MHELFLKPREASWIEGFDQPVNHVPYARNPAATGVVGQPDIQRSVQLDLQWNQLPAQRNGVAREYADSGAIRDRPVVGARDVGLHDQQVTLRNAREEALKCFLGSKLVGELQHQTVLDQFVGRAWRAVFIEVLLRS